LVFSGREPGNALVNGALAQSLFDIVLPLYNRNHYKVFVIRYTDDINALREQLHGSTDTFFNIVPKELKAPFERFSYPPSVTEGDPPLVRVECWRNISGGDCAKLVKPYATVERIVHNRSHVVVRASEENIELLRVQEGVHRIESEIYVATITPRHRSREPVEFPDRKVCCHTYRRAYLPPPKLATMYKAFDSIDFHQCHQHKMETVENSEGQKIRLFEKGYLGGVVTVRMRINESRKIEIQKVLSRFDEEDTNECVLDLIESMRPAYSEGDLPLEFRLTIRLLGKESTPPKKNSTTSPTL
jgi:hypothetical protein